MEIKTMTRAATTTEQWAEAKALWEGETKISYADIGATLGISKQAVAKKAKAEKWQKRMDLAKVVNRAQEMADRSIVDEGLPLATLAREGGKQRIPVDDPAAKKDQGTVEHMEAEEVDTSHMSLEQRAEAIAIKKRAEILTRHRSESHSLRVNLYQSMKDKNFELGKVAKINSEAMQIIHNLERKAWGLDSGTGDGNATIIIERG